MSQISSAVLRVRPGLLIGLALALAGCGGGAPPSSAGDAAPAVVATATTPAPPRPVALPKEPQPGPELPPLNYQAKGRRDPFVPVTLAKDKPTGLSVESLKLTGIIRGRALLALVEAPDGVGYILKPGDVLGDGRVTDITESSVSFAVTAKAGQPATTVTRRLGAD